MITGDFAGALRPRFVGPALGVLLASGVAAAELSPLERLGKALLFDANLSTPPGQSCATFHGPHTGFTGPDSAVNAATAVYPGAVHSRFGNRRPPTAADGGESPVLHYDKTEGVWVGGMFWDGRASGWTLGDPLAEQAQGPFLNPLEQNVADAKGVCEKVARGAYTGLFEEVWGRGSLDCERDAAGSYERVARAIAAYERSRELSPFTSKYDAYLKGQVTLTRQEEWGLELFEGKGLCNACHLSAPREGGLPPLFTDFTYDNLGIPRNPANPFYRMPGEWNPDGKDWIDPGLGGFLAKTEHAGVAEEEWGKHKVPTLRNVDQRPSPEFVKVYGHNGYFKSLEEIVHFYNTRDVDPAWPEPEMGENVNTEEMGDLGLTPEEEAAIVAFMKTLTDGTAAQALTTPGDGARQ